MALSARSAFDRPRTDDDGPPNQLEDLSDLPLVFRPPGVHERLLEDRLDRRAPALVPISIRDSRERRRDAEIVASFAKDWNRRLGDALQPVRVIGGIDELPHVGARNWRFVTLNDCSRGLEVGNRTIENGQ